MVVTQLIDELKRLDNISKPVLALLTLDIVERRYVSVFGNSQGLLGIYVVSDEPLPSIRQGNVLLEELEIWRESSEFYDPNTDVYLVVNYKYEDGSCDFRHFKVKSIKDEGEHLMLIAENEECIDLREHFEPFDESMYDLDDEE